MPGSLITAAVSHVFTISYVAEMLGEEEEWFHELSSDTFAEDGSDLHKAAERTVPHLRRRIGRFAATLTAREAQLLQARRLRVKSPELL